MHFTIETAGDRLDRFLARQCAGLSRTRLQGLIEAGMVTVNGRPSKPSYKLEPGDLVSLSLPPPIEGGPSPEAIPLKVVYEDADVLVVDKPAGMTVHPAPGAREHTLVNALLAHCPELLPDAASGRPGIVHRLDKDTSGLIVVAKNEAARLRLVEQFRSRSTTKVYLALVVGHVEPPRGVIEGPVGRDPADRKRMAVVEGGREASTRYRVMEHREGHTLLEVTPETGRTHQIRVHLAAIGYPIAGDRVYGGASPLFKRQFLHATKLGFQHPATGERLEFNSPLPPDLRDGLGSLRREE